MKKKYYFLGVLNSGIFYFAAGGWVLSPYQVQGALGEIVKGVQIGERVRELSSGDSLMVVWGPVA